VLSFGLQFGIERLDGKAARWLVDVDGQVLETKGFILAKVAGVF
jgi:hypothetical protein